MSIQNTFWGLFVALALLLIPEKPLKAQTLEELFVTIEALDKEKKYQDALVLVDRSLERFPENLSLLIRHAQLQDSRGNRDMSLTEMLPLRERFPSNDTVLNFLGNLFLHSGLLDSATACFQSALQTSKNKTDSFNALLNLGAVYIYKRDHEKSIAHYESMRKRFGDSLGVLNNLAEAYSQVGRNEKAIQLLKIVIEIAPEYTGVYNNLGMLYTETGDYTEAEKSFNKLLLLEPDNAWALNNYGYLLYKKKEYNKALKNINHSIVKYASNPYAYRNRALVYLALGLSKEACSDLKASQTLGFKTYFGNEVEELLSANNCK